VGVVLRRERGVDMRGRQARDHFVFVEETEEIFVFVVWVTSGYFRKVEKRN
jgi:hypothetical protein